MINMKYTSLLGRKLIHIYLPDMCDTASITKLTLDQGLELATQRLEKFGFIVSNTQPQTPKM